MSRMVVCACVVAGALGVAGCSGIRVVRENRAGGEIALLGGRQAAMEKAEQVMARNCGGPGAFEVVEQGEVVVGETSVSRADQTSAPGRTWSGRPATRTTTTERTDTQQKTEWRVIYQCRGAEPPPAAAPPPAEAPPAGAPASMAPPSHGAIRELRVEIL